MNTLVFIKALFHHFYIPTEYLSRYRVPFGINLNIDANMLGNLGRKEKLRG